MENLLIKGHYKEYDYEYELYEENNGKLNLSIHSSFFVEIYNCLSEKIKLNFKNKKSTSVMFEQEY